MIPGFVSFVENFSPKDQRWSTILLIGRDCVEAQRQEQVMSKTKHIAARILLGWVLVGQRPAPSRLSPSRTTVSKPIFLAQQK